MCFVLFEVGSLHLFATDKSIQTWKLLPPNRQQETAAPHNVGFTFVLCFWQIPSNDCSRYWPSPSQLDALACLMPQTLYILRARPDVNVGNRKSSLLFCIEILPRTSFTGGSLNFNHRALFILHLFSIARRLIKKNVPDEFL